MINGHGGNIYKLAKELNCPVSEIMDMSSNVNPLGPPEGLVNFLKNNINLINALPEADAQSAVNAFAKYHDLDPALIIPGNGTTQIIHTIPMALKTRAALIVGPTYSDYADACMMHKVNYEFFFTRVSDMFTLNMEKLSEKIKDFDTVFICNPNNPTSSLIKIDQLHNLCASHPDTYFIIDESYLPFVDNDENYTMVNCNLSNVMILNSMSKIFRVPGLRIGFLVSSYNVINKFNQYVMPWSLNSLAQAGVIYLMEHKKEILEFIDTTRSYLKSQKQIIFNSFEKNNLIKFFPGSTSFMLGQLSQGYTAENICEFLAKEKVLIRNCSNFQGLSNKFIRISLKDEKTNTKLVKLLLNLK